MKRTIFPTDDGLSRRAVLTIGTAVGFGTVAGCLGTPDERTENAEEETDNGLQGNVGDDVSEETSALAAEMIDAIDDELSVADWQLHGMFVPEYTDSGGVESDVRSLGDAYADIVEQGFDRRSMPTALNDSGITDFMFFLEPEWAIAYLDGEWSEAEYYAEIKASKH